MHHLMVMLTTMIPYFKDAYVNNVCKYKLLDRIIARVA